jgi:membrane protein
MRNIEDSFSQIWRSKRSRPLHRMVMDYILVTLFLPIVAAGVLAINVALQSPAITENFGFLALPLRGFQGAIIVLMFALMYWAVPNAPVRFRYALLGGVVAGIGWLLVSHAYVTFNFGLSRFNILYAGFAQFPLLLMWVYASWVVILFGAELTFAYQNVKTFALERFADTASYAYREAVALRTMLAMARRFEAGEGGIVPKQCAEEWNVPLRVIDEVIDRMAERGLVNELATEPSSYQPAKSLHHTRLREVVEAIREYGKEPSKLREDEDLRETFAEVGLKNSRLLDMTLAEWATAGPAPGKPVAQVTPLRS